MNIIHDAANVSLDQNPGTLPNMATALTNWFQNMMFIKTKKQVINYQNVETPYPFEFQGVMQPFTAQQLSMKPEGQRAWIWYTLHSFPTLALIPDEVVNYLGKQYRVMQKIDYTQYGYVEYHLVQDYVGSGP